MKAKALTISLMLVAFIASSMTAPPVGTATTHVEGTEFIFTTDADFDQGMLVNVNHDAPNNDQLQLNEQTQPFPFVNVAASGRGTLARIDTNTGEVVGEYWTAPEGRGLDPSRTTVDLHGNVWAGNRGERGLIDGVAHGSVVKIGLVMGGTRVDGDGTPNSSGDYLAPPFDYNTCVDRNGDGLLKTSRGLGDIRPWPDSTDGVGGTDGVVEDADDECILVYQRVPVDTMNEDAVIRHVSVDASNNVWTGDAFTGEPSFHLLNGNTGAILASLDKGTVGCGGYGGLVDGNGILWSASRGPLLRYDPASGIATCLDVRDSYGVGIDTNGFIWISMWDPNAITKLSPSGIVQPGFPKITGGTDGDRGVAVTPEDNHVWVAKTSENAILRLDKDGNVLKYITACGPTGVAVDGNGKVWAAVCDSAIRIDPDGGEDGLGAVDLTVDLGPGSSPYNYSDMTGMVAMGWTSPQGTWSVVKDAGIPGSEWGPIVWNTEAQGIEPPGTEIVVEALAADSEAGLGGEAFRTVSNGVPFTLAGRFIEVRLTLKAAADGTSPVLSDVHIHTAAPTSIERCYCSAVGDLLYRIDASSFRGYATDSASGSPLIHVTSPPAPTSWNEAGFVPDASWQPGAGVWWTVWENWGPLIPGCSIIGLLDQHAEPEGRDGTTHLYRRVFTLSSPEPGMEVTRAVLRMWSDNKTAWWWEGELIADDRERNVGEVELFPARVARQGGTYLLAVQNSNDYMQQRNPHGTAFRLCVTWSRSEAYDHYIDLPLVLK